MNANTNLLFIVVILVTFFVVSCFSEALDSIVRGFPCVKKTNHLECANPGPNYPSKSIESFINENRATIRRMFGEIAPPISGTIDASQRIYERLNESSSDKKSNRVARSMYFSTQDDKIDSCESSVEIITPYWAANSAGKIRAIVNTQHLQQAIQQEICRSSHTKNCKNHCNCDQKYKWHRLLAYDPDDDCKGIFMDWFLFPSCCVCRCSNVFLGNS